MGSECKCLRWFLKLSKWNPEPQQYLKAIQAIQPEEWSAAKKKMFVEDLKASLLGRLLLRKAVCLNSTVEWGEISLKRGAKGKPYWDPGTGQPPNWDVNVSHHGDVVVLAADCSSKCGVDVMKVELPRGKDSISDYLSLMSRQFSREENIGIQAQATDWMKLFRFFRLWSLKESYIKAIGAGIYSPLSDLDFRINSDLMSNRTANDTVLHTNGAPLPQWHFQEILLDQDYVTATCTDQSQFKADNPSCSRPSHFEEVFVPFLLSSAVDLQRLEPDLEWKDYKQKKIRL